jgi:hypothetical protein
MMKLLGTIRSKQIWEQQGSGPTADDARNAAIEGIPDGFELITVSALPSKVGEAVVRNAVARSTEKREIEGEGDTYEDAEAALRAGVPDGWMLLDIRVPSPAA